MSLQSLVVRTKNTVQLNTVQHIIKLKQLDIERKSFGSDS